MKRYAGNMMVYFTGSNKTIERTIYTEDGLYYVKWQGNMVEVEQTRFGWRTVENY